MGEHLGGKPPNGPAAGVNAHAVALGWLGGREGGRALRKLPPHGSEDRGPGRKN